MVKLTPKQILIGVLLLLSLWITGCQASDGNVFDDSRKTSNPEPSTQNRSRRFRFRQMDAAFPSSGSIELKPELITDDSISVSLSPIDLGDNVFQLDVRAHEFTTGERQIYDLPLVLRFNPNILQISDSSIESVSLIEGSEQNRLRSYLDPGFSILVGKTERNPLQRISDCQPACGYYWIANSLTREVQPRNRYDGILFSVLVEVKSASTFSTPIGFDTQNSSVLDRNGSALDVRYIGGMIEAKR